MPTISRDTPLTEITLRRYEKPQSSNRDLVRKLCLSLGLLQPGDSRDIIVDTLYTLLLAKKEQKPLHSEEIKNQVIETRKKLNLPLLGIASSNIRRQLKRLKDLFLIETINNQYRITEFSPLTEIFQQKTKNFLLASILQRVEEHLQKIDQEF